jgi:hypothetical protein
MATNFTNRIYNGLGGGTDTTIYSTNSATKATVIGFNCTNTSRDDCKIDIKIQNTTSGTTAYYFKQIPIPAGSTLRVLNDQEKIVLEYNCSLIVNNTSNNALDIVWSGVEVY